MTCMKQHSLNMFSVDFISFCLAQVTMQASLYS